MKTTKKIAVLLCGSGFKDGSEVRESVGVLWALSKHAHAQVECFALDAPQRDVVNCLTKETMPETRNQLVESARIARGQVQDLKKLKVKDFDAIIIPGGFGAAKNLCDFAINGAKGTANEIVKEKLVEFYNLEKPIGAVCIAPAVVALAMPNKSFELTVGGESDAAKAVTTLGHHHHITAPNECCVDKKNKIVTSPAYMYHDAVLADIFTGIEKLVGEVLKLA